MIRLREAKYDDTHIFLRSQRELTQIFFFLKWQYFKQSKKNFFFCYLSASGVIDV